MVRSLAVVAFIAAVGGLAAYLFQRPTNARGEVLADTLMESNASVLRSLRCDPDIPIGVDGARFWCLAQFKRGGAKRLQFRLDRAGGIRQVAEADPERSSEGSRPEPAPSGDGAPDGERPAIEKADPWE